MATIDKLVTANTKFAFRLFAEIAKKDTSGNIFISPYSIAMALAMAFNGAGGETKLAMAKALDLKGMSLDQVNQAHAKLRETLEKLDPQIQIAIANSLWAKKGESFKRKFATSADKFYAARVANFDPGDAQVINDWVSSKTNDKIKNLVTEQIVSVAVLILINAIYFKGNWTVKFDPAATRELEFTLPGGQKKRHPMLSQSGRYRYYKNEQFQAVSLPYGNGRASMYIFLPSPGSSLAKFCQSLTSQNWEEWMPQFRETKGNIILPRFKIEYGISLRDILKGLGMDIAFRTQADFEEMCPGVFIGEAIHKAFVEVNEEGTEAAAATAVVMMRAVAPSAPFNMVVDRPFFCAIRDDETGTILFLGSIVDPQ